MATMELSELRKRIDALDRDIRALLLERLDIARDVAKAKIDSGNTTIYRGDREREILDRLTEGLDADASRLMREIYLKIMLSSRSIQYRMITHDTRDVAGCADLEDASAFCPERLICQGIAGSYSHIAAMRLCADADVTFVPSFGEVFDSISGQNYGILPLDNSTQGMVTEVYDLLLSHGLYIVKSIDLPIRHSALVNKGAKREDIRYITAHSQALYQCSRYIDGHGLTRIAASNNAIAARDVVESGRVDMACICDESNAERYGLEVLDRDIEDSAVNTTRFIVVSDRLIAPSAGGRVSIVFSVGNTSGMLANVLNIIASYGISMSKIESRPIADDKWEYRFYIDLEGNIRESNMVALLYQLESELPFIKILGSYDGLREEKD